MKKLLVLVMVLGMVSFASAVPLMELVDNGDGTYGISMPSGMSGAADGTGVYFVITGVDVGSGSLTSAADPLTLSCADYGDAGDTGLFEYGLGTYGEFRATNTTYSVGAGTYADGYSGNASVISLYTLDDSMLEATLADQIIIPEPATIALLCLGGLLLRKK